ncbi:Uncharacterised protein [Mycobacteroides abscessus]|nr:Uncharacterised protein [Mycobacteroides abscessus]
MPAERGVVACAAVLGIVASQGAVCYLVLETLTTPVVNSAARNCYRGGSDAVTATVGYRRLASIRSIPRAVAS